MLTPEVPGGEDVEVQYIRGITMLNAYIWRGGGCMLLGSARGSTHIKCKECVKIV